MRTFVAKVDLNGTFITFNKSALLASGLTEEEFQATNFVNAPWWTFDKQVHERMKENWRNVLTGQSVSYDERLKYGNGTIGTISFNLEPVCDNTGRILYVVAEGRDITAQKAAENELRKNQALLDETQSLAHVGSWEWDIVNDFIYWSDEIYKILEFDDRPKPLKFQDAYNYTHPDDRAKLQAIVEGIFKDASPFSYESRFTTPKGNIKTIAINGKITCDARGKPIRVIGVGHDITLIKRAEEKLRTAHHELEARVKERTSELEREIQERQKTEDSLKFFSEVGKLFNSSLELEKTLKNVVALAAQKLRNICIIDIWKDEKITTIAMDSDNETDLKQAQFIREKYPPKTDNKVFQYIMRTGSSILLSQVKTEFLEEVAQDKTHFEMLKTLGPTSAMLIPLKVRDQIFGIMTFSRHKVEPEFTREDLRFGEELAQRAAIAIDNATLYQQAQEAIRVRDEFLSIASHELKTPITSLKLQLQMGQRNKLVKENKTQDGLAISKLLNVSNKQVDRLTNLVEDLLDVSKIQRGKLDFVFEETDLNEVINEVLERLSGQLNQAQCHISFTPNPEAKGFWDRSRVDQIFVNLISNAIKYAPGDIKIAIEKSGLFIKVIVKDFGPGIEKSKQQAIFGRFARATSSRSISGLGLGLFIINEISKAHHGHVDLESDVGKGSTFTVTLPVDSRKANNAFLH